MDNDNKPEIQNRSFNDVLGIGEATKSLFNFFGKIIDKLPFSNISPYQTQFIVIFCVINLIVMVSFFLGKAPILSFYIALGFDMLLAIYSLILSHLKNGGK